MQCQTHRAFERLVCSIMQLPQTLTVLTVCNPQGHCLVALLIYQLHLTVPRIDFHVYYISKSGFCD